MSHRARHGGLAYQVKSRPVAGGEFRPFACAACHRCETSKEIRLASQANNPEWVEKKFRADGWKFSAWNKNEITCPSCIATGTAARRGDSGCKTEGVEIVRPEVKLTLAAPPNKSALSVEEKQRVRGILTGTFDEATGQYSEGWSDQRVAKEAGDLPPKLVSDLREIAFGPVRAVTELESFRKELESLNEQRRADVEALQTKLKELEASLADRVAKLSQRINDTALRLGVRS